MAERWDDLLFFLFTVTGERDQLFLLVLLSLAGRHCVGRGGQLSIDQMREFEGDIDGSRWMEREVGR